MARDLSTPLWRVMADTIIPTPERVRSRNDESSTKQSPCSGPVLSWWNETIGPGPPARPAQCLVANLPFWQRGGASVVPLAAIMEGKKVVT
jgi:hypothetical protein